MMEKKRIGSNAGKVWRILNEKGEQSMFTLRMLNLPLDKWGLTHI